MFYMLDVTERNKVCIVYCTVNLNKLSVSKQQHLFMLILTVYNYWRDANNYQHTCFYKIICFSVQFPAIVNRFIVKT